MNRICLIVSLLCLIAVFPRTVHGQTAEPEFNRKEYPTTYGVQFGFSLLIPNSTSYRGEDFSFFEAGQRFSYGAYANMALDHNVQFSPYIGMEQVFFRKSENYSNDCTLDSFPTFLSTADTVPGRDFRYVNIAFNPAFRFFLPRAGIYLKVQPQFSYTFRIQHENYPFACGITYQQNFLDHTENEQREYSSILFGVGGGIVKEVMLGERTGIAIEPGFNFYLSSWLRVRDEQLGGPTFNLYPWGFYLNFSIFR